MNIEVGEYVRTKDGRIGKLDEIYHVGRGTRYYGEDLYKNYYSIKYNSDDDFGRYSDEEIVKHSKNIIDLIEEGDFVNGYRVEDIGRTFVNVATGSNYFQDPIIFDIKSIVTKEQFYNMEYRV